MHAPALWSRHFTKSVPVQTCRLPRGECHGQGAGFHAAAAHMRGTPRARLGHVSSKCEHPAQSSQRPPWVAARAARFLSTSFCGTQAACVALRKGFRHRCSYASALPMHSGWLLPCSLTCRQLVMQALLRHLPARCWKAAPQPPHLGLRVLGSSQRRLHLGLVNLGGPVARHVALVHPPPALPAGGGPQVTISPRQQRPEGG